MVSGSLDVAERIHRLASNGNTPTTIPAIVNAKLQRGGGPDGQRCLFDTPECGGRSRRSGRWRRASGRRWRRI